MADSVLRAWWDRIRGRLQPRPCPYALAGALEVPGRKLIANPAKILGEFGIIEGETVVELGPGTGFYSAEAARRVGHSGLLICLDLQFEMLRHTRECLNREKLAAVFVQANAHDLPLQSASIDHVFLITVFGEIPDRARALQEIARVLRVGGRLSVCEQFPDPDFVTLGTLRRELTSARFSEKNSKGWLFYTSTWSRL